MQFNNQFAATVVAGPKLEDSISKAADQIAEQLNGPIDLLFAFFSEHEPEFLDQFTPALQKRTGASNVVGCSAESVIGMGKEFEAQPAVSLWAASLPNDSIDCVHLEYERSPDGGVITGWPDGYENGWADNSSLITLGDPFSFPMDVLLDRFNEDRPGVNIIGGMCSGADVPGHARLLLNDETHSSGVVAVRITGDSMQAPVVSQGCRPIGETFVITAAEQNVIKQLGGEPALKQLKKIFRELPARDQRMIETGLHIGRVINEYQDTFQYGDFLIRNVIGFNQEEHSITIGDYVRPGQTVQFHVRDHQSADVEMNQLLNDKKDSEPAAALIFSCNGRGLRLFPDPHHDASTIESAFGSIPNAGFFAAGEIGPVGGQNFVHGFTASVALFK